MEECVIVATHASSLFSVQPTTIPVQTSRRNAPLPPTPSTTPPVEHARFASVLHTKSYGTLLLRVVHAGLILEVTSLSAPNSTSPLRFVLPATVISNPAIVEWDMKEIHVLAVTSAGSVFRIVLPVASAENFWEERRERSWCREYILKNPANVANALVEVVGPHDIAIALQNGGLLRLDADYEGIDSPKSQWTETSASPSPFFSGLNLTSFLPGRSTSSEHSAIVSIASAPLPTTDGIWTLSRDRTLRLWSYGRGCLDAKRLATSPQGRASTPMPDGLSSPSRSNPNQLLEAEPQTLLRGFIANGDTLGDTAFAHPYVLAFVPTPSSAIHGGFFTLFQNVSDKLIQIATIASSRTTPHCHLQDFVVHRGVLLTLWDKQGQSVLERRAFDVSELQVDVETDGPEQQWSFSAYPPEPELTPAYLDTLLLSPGSLPATFLSAILAPGRFSSLTLRIAIDQYTDACLSLPGPAPTPLGATYGSIGEHIAAVVGCTVSLLRDKDTGALKHANYWNALKRDWEGFAARCREIERSARRPLAVGLDESGDVLVIERERVGSLVAEDMPLQLHRRLLGTFPLDPPYALVDITWTLRQKLPAALALTLESKIAEMLQQEMAFALADIVQDQATRIDFKGALDEGMESWIGGRLTSVEDLGDATRSMLNILAIVDDAIVKREEDEVEMLVPASAPASQGRRALTEALTAVYVEKTMHARYELGLALVILMFFVSDDLPEWDPSLLAEVFAVFRGIAMLRAVSRHPAGPSASLSHGEDRPTTAADDVVTHMRNMQVSATHGSRAMNSTNNSLIHRLLSCAGAHVLTPSDGPPTRRVRRVAHRFIDASGMLQSISPAQATRSEVEFCERLRTLGCPDIAREMLGWLPRTPGVCYVQAKIWMAMGRVDDATLVLEKLASCFATPHAMNGEDADALAAVAPPLDSAWAFYLHAADLFKAHSHVHYDVLFSQRALTVAPPGIDTSAIWYNIISGYTGLGLIDDAYMALATTPYDQLKRDCVGALVYRVCEENAFDKLMSLNFAGFSEEVEDALSFKARNTDPRLQPSYSRILYTWYTSRGDYRNAALAMYQRGRKLQELKDGPSTFLELSEEELEAYSVAINSLSLLDRKQAWIVMPVAPESGRETRKRRKLSRHIPESKFAPGRNDAEIIELSDIQYDYTLLSARMDLIRKDPSTLSTGGFMLPPASLVLRLAQASRFDAALVTARSLNVDLSELFSQLTRQCLILSQRPESLGQEDTADWLFTDKVSSWQGTTADRGWRYLRQALERHDTPETDFKYSKVVLESILGFDGCPPPPPWLIQRLKDHHPEFLVRTTLRYDTVDAAMEHALSLIHQSNRTLSQELPKHAFSTWLPYTLIDQVLLAAATEAVSAKGKALRQDLETELASRVKRVEKMSRF